MKRVSVELLKAGAVLAQAVVNESGMILIGEGTVLKDSHIDRLQGMSINSVFVEGTSGPTKSKAELVAELDARFKKTEDEPYMLTVKRMFKEYIEGMKD